VASSAPEEVGTFICFALGSQDHSLSVWFNGAKRPLAVISHCFKQSVMDLAWTPEGRTLLACSTDGTVGVFTFEQQELGTPLPQAVITGTNRIQSVPFGIQTRTVDPCVAAIRRIPVPVMMRLHLNPLAPSRCLLFSDIP
jgi:WD40 repeat protein